MKIRKNIKDSLTAKSKSNVTLLLFALTGTAVAALLTVSYSRVRKLYKELGIVCEKDVQVDLSRRELFNEMLLHVFDNPNVDRFYKVELMDKVKKACKHTPNLLRYRYGRLYKRLKKEYPGLTPEELSVCWYIPAALGLDASAYESVRQGMLSKTGKQIMAAK